MITPSVARGLTGLGADLRTTRLKRRIGLQDFADRVGVSARTISRLEKGDEGVGIGTLAMACLVLGELDRFARLLDPSSDETGLLLEQEALPRRIVRPGSSRAVSSAKRSGGTIPENDEGVGF